MSRKRTAEPEPRCHMSQGVNIPGCWGAVIYGDHACTCEAPESDADSARIEKLEAKVARLMEQVRELRKGKS